MHFFDISTSKSGPDLMCFVRFDFEICFAPQRRALFRHLNLQKWSEREVALAFSVANVLRATMACNFFISHLASAALASLLFDPPEPQIIGTMKKHSVSQLSYLCARLDLLSSETFSLLIFFLLRFSFLALPISAFHLSILSDV